MKFEYKTLKLSCNMVNIQEHLNHHASNGWRVVSTAFARTHATALTDNDVFIIVILERPIKEV